MRGAPLQKGITARYCNEGLSVIAGLGGVGGKLPRRRATVFEKEHMTRHNKQRQGCASGLQLSELSLLLHKQQQQPNSLLNAISTLINCTVFNFNFAGNPRSLLITQII